MGEVYGPLIPKLTGGVLVFEAEYHPRKKNSHNLGRFSELQNWKIGYVFGHIDKFWKGHNVQIKKNTEIRI